MLGYTIGRLIFVVAFGGCTYWWAKGGGVPALCSLLLALGTYLWFDLSAPSQVQADRSPHDIADEGLFEYLSDSLPERGSIRFLRNNTGCEHFRRSELDDLRSFDTNWRDDPRRTFHSEELQERLEKLRTSIDDYLNFVGLNTYKLNENGFYGVSPEMQHEQPDKWWEAESGLRNRADRVLHHYEAMIRIGKDLFG